MTVRLYTSRDTGAPNLPGPTFNDNIKTILLACLVNGYGGKPAAGWTVGHDVSEGFSLGNGEGFINFVKEGGSTSVIYLMEAITSGVAALAEGVNRRSGPWTDGSSSSVRHKMGIWTNTLPDTQWCVVADEKTAIFYFTSYTGGADQGTHFYARALYFGSYINSSGLEGASLFCALGGGTAAGNQMGNSHEGTVLRSPFTGLSSEAMPAGLIGARYRFDGVISARGPLVPSRLFLVPCSVQSNTGRVAGYARGLRAEPTLSSALLSEVMALFGKANSWDQRVQPIVFPDGNSYMPLFVNTSAPGFFISLDPSDWG